MVIKKVTIADLENISGGDCKGITRKVCRGEKKATKQIVKEYAEKLKAKNARLESGEIEGL